MQNKKYLRGHRQKIAEQARQKQGQRPRVFTTMQIAEPLVVMI